jgi:hypothetical protein
LDAIGRDEAFSEHGFRVSAQPPAKKTAGLIEIKTDEVSYEQLKNFK